MRYFGNTSGGPAHTTPVDLWWQWDGTQGCWVTRDAVLHEASELTLETVLTYARTMRELTPAEVGATLLDSTLLVDTGL